jgi:cell filamentation protein
MSDRYSVAGNAEGEFQPGSQDRVLRNRRGISDPQDMDDLELSLLREMQVKLLEEIEYDQGFVAADLCNWHRRWLGSVYAWAGSYHTVNMQKDGYPFAAAQRIPDLMKAFDITVLALQTPCNQMDSERLAEALGISHVEFIVIHPFREGNGRLSRVLATMMALQAGQPPLDFTWMAENKREYFAAIQNGHAGNYEPIKKIFSLVLQSSQRED